MWIAIRILWAALWVLWGWPFLFRAPHGQKREHITVAGPTRAGLFLETAAIFLVAIVPMPDPPGPWRIAAALAVAAVAILSGWAAIRHLGRQFRIQAGLYHDHELVRTGPYGVVRHPIYASLLLMLVANILLLSTWSIACAAIAIYILGTEIRVRTEDRLLASRFGDEFEKYRRAVAAYIPFIR